MQALTCSKQSEQNGCQDHSIVFLHLRMMPPTAKHSRYTSRQKDGEKQEAKGGKKGDGWMDGGRDSNGELYLAGKHRGILPKHLCSASLMFNEYQSLF